MKMRLTIISIKDGGDDVQVTANGSADTDGRYAPDRCWTFAVPTHIGKKYRLGQRLTAEIKAA